MAENRQQAALHQPSEIHVRGVLLGAAAIVIGIALAALVAYVIWQRWGLPSGAQPLGGPNAGALPNVAQPVLQTAPQEERAKYFAEKQRLIDSWEWIDKQRGVARIPVEEAMRVMAAKERR